MKGKELETLMKKAARGLTEGQLARRKFCRECLEYKTKKRFKSSAQTGDGRSNFCRLCEDKKKKAADLKRKLLAHEVYVPGANQIVVDKAVAGRNLVSKRSLAAFLGVNERTVMRARDRGELTGYDFLGQLYFKKEDVEAWLKEKLGEKIELASKYIDSEVEHGPQ